MKIRRGSEPTARKRDGLRLLAEILAPYLREQLNQEDVGEPAYYDQQNSPLGRRRHLAVVRSGHLPGRKVGRQVLVRRDDLHAFIEAHPDHIVSLEPDRDDVLEEWGLSVRGVK